MITSGITQRILFSPIVDDGADALLILSGYATPNMASWFMKDLCERKLGPIDIKLLVGMTPYDGLSISAHEGFKELHKNNYGHQMSRFQCGYVFDSPVHSNLYIWMRESMPIAAFTGSMNFMQNSFLSGRKELAEICNPAEALTYFNEIEKNSIICNYNGLEDHIVLKPKHIILDDDGIPQTAFSGDGIEQITLSLLSRSGETGAKSGLNWGQRTKRNKNQAYIPLPHKIAKSGFFPLQTQHFTVETDDGHTLILRVEQENDKAITTPLSNAQLGEYFRYRLGLPNGAYVRKCDLLKYGRTDVTFYKIDGEEFYMDFSVHAEI